MGLYIFGGIVLFFFMVFMLGILVKLVGCKEIVFCFFLCIENVVYFVVIYVVNLVGVMKIFKVGGV